MIAACVGLLAAQVAPAQSRRTAPVKRESVRKPEDAALQLARLEGWLHGLKGTYQLQVASTSVPELPCRLWSAPNGMCLEWGAAPATSGAGAYNGMAECYGIGDGPGVRCFFSTEYPIRPGLPMVVLFGVEAGDPALRVLSTDVHGFTTESRGTFSGDAIKLDTQCSNADCGRLVQLRAGSEGRVVEILFFPGRVSVRPGAELPSSNVRIQMRRQLPTMDAPPAGAQ